MRKIKKRQMDLSPSKRVVAKRLSLIYILFIGGVGFLSVDLFRTNSEKEVIDFNNRPYSIHHLKLNSYYISRIGQGKLSRCFQNFVLTPLPLQMRAL